MRKYLLLVGSLAILAISGCLKKGDEGCKTVDPAAEEPQILAYAAANGMTPGLMKHSSGLYYQVINAGTGVTPTVNSVVTVNYVGKLLSGSTFDQGNGFKSRLSGVIEGWQIGVPLIKSGGKIKLLIPSAYAYGCNGSGPIPANAVLYFDIDLTKVE